jgi:hypothetical protein
MFFRGLPRREKIDVKFGSGIEKYVSAEMKRRLLAGDEPEWMKTHSRRGYIVASTLAAPFWIRREEFRALRELETLLTEQTGVKHRLDHIVPISHPYVCGLNVPWNIQVLPHAVNAAKSNKWHPDQLVLELAWP